MKKIVFLIIFFVFTIDAFSQNDLILLRNKFSVNLFSYLRRPVISEKNDYYLMFIHGLIYTRQIGFNRYIRGRFDYFQRNIDHSIPDEHIQDIHLYSDIQMGAGFLQGFGEKVVKPYLAGDFLFISALIYSETGGESTGTYEKLQVRRMGMSFLPTMGVTIKATSVVSFSLETNLELGYVYEKGTDFTWTATGIPLEQPVRRSLVIARWNPVGLLSFELSF